MNKGRRIKSALSAVSRIFGSLKNPVYRLLFLGMLGQFASMNMQMVTGSLLIYRLTGSSALLGTMSLAMALPMIFISLFGGAVADRVQKKGVLVFGLMSSAVVSLGIAIALTIGFLSRENSGSWWLLIFSAFLQGSILGFMMPARQAIIPEIINKELVMNAIALNWLGMNVLSLLAPGLAGVLIDNVGFDSVYYTMAGLNLYGGIMMIFLPRTSQVSQRAGNLIKDIKDGFIYIRKDNTIFFILIFTLLVVMLSMPFQQFLPIFTDDILKVGATGLGILMMVSGAGALAGSLVMAALPNRKRGLLLLFSGLLSGMALVVFAFSSSWTLSLAVVVFIGLAHTLRGTLGSTLLQAYTESAYMGRVMSILMMQWGVMSLCTFFAGLVAEIAPVQWVIGSLAMVLITFSILALLFNHSVKRLD
ncbi:MAG: MFS transporter [Dehalococcoidales bacterium]|nr:MFS transporter [Dehalococcoidales bacterium]